MPRDTVKSDLERCVRERENGWWLGARALNRLPAGVDHRLVERAMRVTFAYSAGACLRLRAEYVPIAWRVLAKVRTPSATFLRCYDGDDDDARLREGSAWLRTLGLKTDTRRLATLCANPIGLAAARAAVVAHGLDAGKFIPVLAFDGEDGSIDALVELVARALDQRGDALDRIAKLVRPYARTPRMKTIAAELETAIAKLAAASPVLALAHDFGDRRDRAKLDVSIDSVEVRVGLTRKASAWVVLDSCDLPNVKASVAWNTINVRLTLWKDGRLVANKAKVGGPRGLDDLPRWLAACARQLGVRWDRATLRVESTLRGKVRAAAVAWLLTPPPGARRRRDTKAGSGLGSRIARNRRQFRLSRRSCESIERRSC